MTINLVPVTTPVLTTCSYFRESNKDAASRLIDLPYLQAMQAQAALCHADWVLFVKGYSGLLSRKCSLLRQLFFIKHECLWLSSYLVNYPWFFFTPIAWFFHCAPGAWFFLPVLKPGPPAVAFTREQCSEFHEFQQVASFAKNNLGILDHSLLSQPVKMFSAWSSREFWRGNF